MASTSYGVVTPSDVRRRRAARFSVSPFQDFEPPSFSLGIEIESVRSLPSFDECAWPNAGRDEASLQIDADEEDGPLAGTADLVSILKRSAGNTCDAISNRQSGVVGTWNEPPPSVGDTQTKAEDVEILNSFGSRLDNLVEKTSLPLDSGQTRVLKRLRRGPAASGQPTKRSRVSERDTESRGVHIKFSKDAPSRAKIVVDLEPQHTTAVRSFREDVDEIEDFSEDDLFRFGSLSTPDRRSLQSHEVENPDRRSPQPPRKVENDDPILISSSPEKCKKPILNIPGLDTKPGFPKTALKLSHSTPVEDPVSEDDTFCVRKSQCASESPWRSTRPLVGRSVPMYDLTGTTSLDSQRANSMQQVSKSSIPDVARTIQTQTPMKRDIVGASRAFQSIDYHPEENEILRLLRERLPHYKPVDAVVVDGGLDNEPVYIDYRKQFLDSKGSSESQVRKPGTIRRPSARNNIETFSSTPRSANVPPRQTGAKRKFAGRGQPKTQWPGRASSASGNVQARSRGQRGSGEGHWRTVNGTKVYVVGGAKLSGRPAYYAYKDRAGSSKPKSKQSAAKSDKRAVKWGKRAATSEKRAVKSGRRPSKSE